METNVRTNNRMAARVKLHNPLLSTARVLEANRAAHAGAAKAAKVNSGQCQ